MEQVNGIGGIFFRARDPVGLAGWYESHLGVKKTPMDYDMEPWSQKEGETVFAPFPVDTDYWELDNQFMVNFRVDDMDAMVTQLREAGIDVDLNEETYPNGRFAHLHDPEGNRIELWEPA